MSGQLLHRERANNRIIGVGNYADHAYATAGCLALWQKTHLQDDVVGRACPREDIFNEDPCSTVGNSVTVRASRFTKSQELSTNGLQQVQ